MQSQFIWFLPLPEESVILLSLAEGSLVSCKQVCQCQCFEFTVYDCHLPDIINVMNITRKARLSAGAAGSVTHSRCNCLWGSTPDFLLEFTTLDELPYLGHESYLHTVSGL